MTNSTISIKDTGLNKVGGTALYTPANSGNWLDLYGFSLNGEFNVNTTDNDAYRNEDSSNLTFSSNEISSINAPRFTLRGIVPLSTSATTIGHLLNMRTTKSVKLLTGGLGLIDNYSDAVSVVKGAGNVNAIYVIITNVTFSEESVDTNDSGNENIVNFTIQLEQVN